MSAKVILVGAGPGDPDLISIKGARAIAQSDVVVYDYLANRELLSFARDDAKFIYVGKHGFEEHITQDEINRLLLREALAGAKTPDASHTVVCRLKGGDPFVFGRGGEEALFLREHGIEVDVVPGITSGIAAPAAASIPVTHRGLSSCVSFITANEDPTKPKSAIDWEAISHSSDTLCFFMSVHNLEQVSEKLISSGRARTTPAALVRWATTPKQEVLVGSLADIAKRAHKAHLMPPAILIVGDVVKLYGKLKSSAKLPLSGRSFAVTRSRTQAGVLVERLRALGAWVIKCPTIRIVELDDYSASDAAIASLAQGAYTWLVFTSVNGVTYFFARLARGGFDARNLAGISIAAVGPSTAATLEAHALKADVVSKIYSTKKLAQTLIQEGIGKNDNVLIARALIAQNTLAQLLSQAGAHVDVAALYQTLPAYGPAFQDALEQIERDEVDSITFTSSSAVENFAKLAGDKAQGLLERLACYSIGPTTTATLQRLGANIAAQAKTYTIDGLIEAIVEDAKRKD